MIFLQSILFSLSQFLSRNTCCAHTRFLSVFLNFSQFFSFCLSLDLMQMLFFVVYQIDANLVRQQYCALKAKVASRPQLRSVRSVQALAEVLNSDPTDRSDLQELLKLMDYVLSVPLSNAGIVCTYVFAGIFINLCSTFALCDFY